MANFDFGVEIPSSQDSNLDENELDNIITQSKPENTKKCTNWGFHKFQRWAEKRNIVVDFKTITPNELNEILRKFYAEVKSEKGTMLTPSSMTGIRAAIMRTILSPPYSRNMNIISDREFATANDMFSAKAKLYYKTHNKKPTHKAYIEQSDMTLLGQYFANALADPVKLQEFNWFNICFQFGRRGREGWRELKKDHFQINTDTKGHRYLTIILTESTKNNPGGHNQSSQDYSDVRMYEISSNPMDPVAAFEFYLEKLHPENPNLFAKAKKTFMKDEVWYTKEVIGKNTLANIMKEISRKAGLSKSYTNHCVRASTVTHLYQAGVDTQQICSITKHKNEATLSHYISASSDEQKRSASSILSRSLVPSLEPVSVVQSENTPNEIQELSLKTSHLMQSVMPNSTFNNCTINFQGFSKQSC